MLWGLQKIESMTVAKASELVILAVGQLIDLKEIQKNGIRVQEGRCEGSASNSCQPTIYTTQDMGEMAPRGHLQHRPPRHPLAHLCVFLFIINNYIVLKHRNK